jgi:hypothetical protein
LVGQTLYRLLVPVKQMTRKHQAPEALGFVTTRIRQYDSALSVKVGGINVLPD